MALDKPDSRKCGGCLEGSCSIQLSYGGLSVRIGAQGDDRASRRHRLAVALQVHHRRVAVAEVEQVLVAAELRDAPALQHRDLLGARAQWTADGRSRSPSGRRRDGRAPPARRAPCGRRGRWSPRRGSRPAGCAGRRARSRSAASRRPRSDSRARRRPCRSPPAATRSGRGSGRPALPPRPPRRSRPGGRSAGSRAPRHGTGRSPATPRRRLPARLWRERSRTSMPSILTAPSCGS